jgi:hypothetical protein
MRRGFRNRLVAWLGLPSLGRFLVAEVSVAANLYLDLRIFLAQGCSWLSGSGGRTGLHTPSQPFTSDAFGKPSRFVTHNDRGRGIENDSKTGRLYAQDAYVDIDIVYHRHQPGLRRGAPLMAQGSPI